MALQRKKPDIQPPNLVEKYLFSKKVTAFLRKNATKTN